MKHFNHVIFVASLLLPSCVLASSILCPSKVVCNSNAQCNYEGTQVGLWDAAYSYDQNGNKIAPQSGTYALSSVTAPFKQSQVTPAVCNYVNFAQAPVTSIFVPSQLSKSLEANITDNNGWRNVDINANAVCSSSDASKCPLKEQAAIAIFNKVKDTPIYLMLSPTASMEVAAETAVNPPQPDMLKNDPNPVKLTFDMVSAVCGSSVKVCTLQVISLSPFAPVYIGDVVMDMTNQMKISAIRLKDDSVYTIKQIDATNSIEIIQK